MGLVSGRKTVAAGGTAEALSATSVAFRRLIITAETDNTNAVTVGGSDVVGAVLTRKGVPLVATSPPLILDANDGIDDLKNVFVDAVTNTEGVTFLAIT